MVPPKTNKIKWRKTSQCKINKNQSPSEHHNKLGGFNARARIRGSDRSGKMGAEDIAQR